MANLTWDFDNEKALLSALAGCMAGATVEATIPEMFERKRSSFNRFVQYARLSSTDIVAEIGGGFGIVSHHMGELVKQVFCVDVSQTYQTVAKRVVTRPNVAFHLISPGDLSGLRDKGVNKICSEACFIHLNLFDIYNYAQQAFEILPKGVYLYLTQPMQMIPNCGKIPFGKYNTNSIWRTVILFGSFRLGIIRIQSAECFQALVFLWIQYIRLSLPTVGLSPAKIKLCSPLMPQQ